MQKSVKNSSYIKNDQKNLTTVDIWESKHLESEKILSAGLILIPKLHRKNTGKDQNTLPNLQKLNNDKMSDSHISMSKKINLLQNNFLNISQKKKSCGNSKRTKRFISKHQKQNSIHLTPRQLQQVKSINPQFSTTYLEILRNYHAAGEQAKRIQIEEQQMIKQTKQLFFKKSIFIQLVRAVENKFNQLSKAQFIEQLNFIKEIKQVLRG